MADHSGAVARAEHLLALGRPQEALAALGPLLTAEPDNVTGLCLAVRAQLGLRQSLTAVRYAEQAVAAAPGQEWPLRLLALAHHQAGHLTHARDAARAAVRAGPMVWEAYHTLARVSSALTDSADEAWEAARRATELAPLEPATHAIMGQVAVGRDRRVAERALKEALRLDPGHAVARNDLGRLQLGRRDPLGAAAHFAAAAASDVRLDVAAHNIDVALVAAARWVLAFVWLVAVVLGPLAAATPGTAGWIYGAVALVALAVLVGWPARKLVGLLRPGAAGRYLRTMPSRDRLLTAIAALLASGLLALVVTCLLPPGDGRSVPLVVGILLLLTSRLVIGARARGLTRG